MMPIFNGYLFRGDDFVFVWLGIAVIGGALARWADWVVVIRPLMRQRDRLLAMQDALVRHMMRHKASADAAEQALATLRHSLDQAAERIRALEDSLREAEGRQRASERELEGCLHASAPSHAPIARCRASHAFGSLPAPSEAAR